MTTKHLIISGLVQGVGYREWLVSTAGILRLNGWVRNCAKGTVEVLIAGKQDAVEECLRACRRGPRLAVVENITENLAETPDYTGFSIRPTA